MAADLSFNKIEKIENLNTLTGLLDLSLYNNKITQIEGLEALEEIKSLSLGNNLIKDLDKVREFKIGYFGTSRWLGLVGCYVDAASRALICFL